MDYAGKNYWVIGASSGIGADFAREIARRGARLALSARRADVLEALATEIGHNHLVFPLDVTRAEDVSTAAKAIHTAFGKIDGIVILSASYTPSSIAEMELERAAEIIHINLMGTLNCIHALLPLLRMQKRGQIALCGSVAGYTGLPRAQPYGATKAAIINIAESLRLEESARGIDVRIINPGFVRTPMTDKNNFDMPMMISSQEAARSLADQLASDSFEIHFPKVFTYFMKLLRLLPYRIYFFLLPFVK